MSLLDDTVLDARRPLVLRRSASEIASAAADETAPSFGRAHPDDVPRPATRVARETGAPRDGDRDDFQREGQSMSREASTPSGSGISRLPTGDPLSAERGADRPKSSANNVGFPDVTVMGDSRTSELATGPEKGRSPGKVAIAAAGSVSMALQSVVLPGSSEAEWSRARSLSMTPEGSTTTVSAGGETFLSRPPGRGAPSENPRSAPASTPAAGPAVPRRGKSTTPPDGASPRTAWTAAPAEPETTGSDDAAAALRTRQRPATDGADGAPGTTAPPLTALPDPPRQRTATGTRTTDAGHAGNVVDVLGGQLRPARAVSGDATPTLHIGRIDVTVVTDTVAALSAAAASLPEASGEAGVSGFLACNYLKRL